MKTIKIIFFNIFFIFIILEIVLRVADFERKEDLLRPYYLNRQTTIKIDSDSDTITSYLVPHREYGWSLRDGKFSVTINDSITHKASHQNNKRISTDTLLSGAREKTIFFGCSYTYGVGVNDESTFAYKTQLQNNKIEIANYAVPGYGTIQSLNQLEYDLDITGVKKVFYFYIPDHDRRNTLLLPKRVTRYFAVKPHWDIYKKYLNGYGMKTGDVGYIYATYNTQNILQKKRMSYDELYTNVPLSDYSVNLYQLELLLNKDDATTITNTPKLTLDILKQMNTLCIKNGVNFYLVGLGENSRTEELLRESQKKGIKTIYINNVDLKEKSMTLYPYDHHPNEKAHDLIAKKLTKELQKIANEN